MLRKIFGSKREEGAGGWRRLHNKKLHKLCFSPNIIRMIKSRRIRWAGHGHLARMKAMINAYNIFLGKSGRKRPL